MILYENEIIKKKEYKTFLFEITIYVNDKIKIQKNGRKFCGIKITCVTL